MRALWLALLLAVAGLPLLGQGATTADSVFEIEFTHPGLSPPRWTMTLHSDGSGHFHTDPAEAAGETAANGENPRSTDLPGVDREIQVSARFARRVFDIAQRHRLFNEECESHLKVAFTGWKKLSYRGPDGSGSCRFSFGADKEIDSLGNSLQSVAEAILIGEKLRLLLQHDRLGLDQEMENLAVADADGRVEQIGVIRGILEQLCDDPRVMERVKKRARLLLTHVDEE
jgi:hypothetical protein